MPTELRPRRRPLLCEVYVVDDVGVGMGRADVNVPCLPQPRPTWVMIHSTGLGGQSPQGSPWLCFPSLRAYIVGHHIEPSRWPRGKTHLCFDFSEARSLQPGLLLSVVLLPLPPNCQNYTYAPPCPAKPLFVSFLVFCFVLFPDVASLCSPGYPATLRTPPASAAQIHHRLPAFS